MIRIGDNPHIILDVKGYLCPEAEDDLDGNWLSADVIVSAGAWQGRYQANVRAEELLELKNELARLYDKLEYSFEFQTMEDWIALRFAGAKMGQITVEGTACDCPGTGNTLAFSFEIDQSYLPGIIEDLQRITDKFPVQ